MQPQRRFSFDWVLIILTLLLLGLGLLMVRSATGTTAALPFWDTPVVRQGVWAAVGLAVLAVASLINYRVWAVWRWPLYGGMLILLALVLLLARANFGARSWLELQALNVQPAELCKIVLIIVLARYLADHEMAVKRGSGLLVSLCLTAPFLGLVFAEPDMGTSVILAAIWLGMLFVAGLRPWQIAALAVAAVVLAPLIWNIMQPHMRERIIMFLYPSANDPKQYNIIQALIAVGSGGMWGKGLGQGTQTQLFFLRVRHTDFIFAVLAEELGFVGALLLLVLFAALLLRILRVSARAADAYGRLVAAGVAIMIFVQIAINIGFHVGLLPVTGLPLPLISYGGSSLLTTLLGLGLVQSVAMYHQPYEVSQ